MRDEALLRAGRLLDRHEIADAVLFFVEFRAARRFGMTVRLNSAAHCERILARPTIRRVVAQEGLA